MLRKWKINRRSWSIGLLIGAIIGVFSLNEPLPPRTSRDGEYSISTPGSIFARREDTDTGESASIGTEGVKYEGAGFKAYPVALSPTGIVAVTTADNRVLNNGTAGSGDSSWNKWHVFWIMSGILALTTTSLLLWRHRSVKNLAILRETEAKLRESEALYRGIVEDQTELICRFDADYRIIFINENYCRYFNIDRNTSIGRSFLDFIVPEDRERITRNITDLNIDNPIVTHEHGIEIEGEGTRWQQWTNRAIFNGNGTIKEYQAVGRDITELKIALKTIRDLNDELEERVLQRTRELEREIDEREIGEQILREQTELLRKIVNNIPTILTFYDENYNFIWVNREYERLLDWTLEEVVGKNILEFFYPDRERPKNPLEPIPEGIFPTRTRAGNTLDIIWTSVKLSDGKIIGIGNDITARMRAETGLQESEARFRMAFVNAPLPVIIHAEDGEILKINGMWTELTGYEPEELRTIENWLERAYDEGDRPGVRAAISRLYTIDKRVNEGEFHLNTKDGSKRIWDFSSAPLGRTGDGRKTFLSMAIDVTEKKIAEERLRHDAFHDNLTGLPNRNLLQERLEVVGALSRQDPGYLFAVLFLDIDRFKVVNDSLGHRIGDLLLIAIAGKLKERVDSKHLVARLGGDEFIILTERLTGPDEAIGIAENICQEFRSPFVVEGREFFISASIGIAFNSDPVENTGDILRNADIAMYYAKEHGKARYNVFDPIMLHRVSRLLDIETSLRLALERYEFLVYYQPIVSLKDGSLAGFEALARWYHPQQGVISPFEFIPVAEETGLIVPLGRWVLFEACRQFQQWREQFPGCSELTISVNLSNRQLQQSDIIDQIERVLEQTGLEGRFLKLEITESVLMKNTENAIVTLSRLREMGIGIGIDDFGTGYSSLSYLHRLPVDTLKIDRSFVGRMSEDGENLAIVGAVITLAHHLGVNVVAEGIETPRQLELLNALNCELGQGYFFSGPLPQDTALAYLQGIFGGEN